jgi:hypothetical protein
MLARYSAIPFMREPQATLERCTAASTATSSSSCSSKNGTSRASAPPAPAATTSPVYADGPDGGFYANELGFGRHNAESDVLETTRTRAPAQRRQQAEAEAAARRSAARAQAGSRASRQASDPRALARGRGLRRLRVVRAGARRAYNGGTTRRRQRVEA